MKVTKKQLVSYVKDGLTTAEIGKRLGCSQAHASKVLNRHGLTTRRPSVVVMCDCGCGRQVNKKRGSRRYYSPECYQKDRLARRVEEAVKAGRIDNPQPRSAKRVITEIHGHQCSDCGLSEWRGNPIVMVLDHINGNPTDWSLGNLRLLCPNCDSQTPTYKGKNKGNGRHSRRKRYREGKSY